MKLYLSSYELGDRPERLVDLVAATTGDNRIGYVPNARDYVAPDLERSRIRTKNDIESLERIGLSVELLDLRSYFGRSEQLRQKLLGLRALWVSGGNAFILRQAMHLSGLDQLLLEHVAQDDFFYGGYSAAGCVLSPSLEAYTIVDDSTQTPYQELKKPLRDGLAILPFTFMPHYDSDHPESADIDREIKSCIEKRILFQAFRDGEVLIADTNI